MSSSENKNGKGFREVVGEDDTHDDSYNGFSKTSVLNIKLDKPEQAKEVLEMLQRVLAAAGRGGSG